MRHFLGKFKVYVIYLRNPNRPHVHGQPQHERTACAEANTPHARRALKEMQAYGLRVGCKICRERVKYKSSYIL